MFRHLQHATVARENEDASMASICEVSKPAFMGGGRDLYQLCVRCNESFSGWLVEGKPLGDATEE